MCYTCSAHDATVFLLAASANTVIDVSRLDFRIGLITTAKKHPEADTLYVEEGAVRCCCLPDLLTPSPSTLSGTWRGAETDSVQWTSAAHSS